MRFSRGLMAFSSHPVLRWWSPGWVVPSWPLGQFGSWMLPLGWTGLGFILPSAWCLDCGALGAGLGRVGTSKPPWRESQSQGRHWGSMCTLCLQTETPTLLKLLSRDKPGCIIRSLIKSTSNFLKTFWAHAYINSGVSHAKLTALQPAFDLHH